MKNDIPLLQTDKMLNEEINRFGCYFMSLLAIPFFMGVDYTICDHEKIESIFSIGKLNNLIGVESFVRNAKGILELLGLNKIKVYWSGLDSVKPDHGALIARYYLPPNYTTPVGTKLNNKELSHFVLLDKNKKVIYDPMGTSLCVKYGSVKDYRVVISQSYPCINF